MSDATTKLLSGPGDGVPSLLVLSGDAPSVVPLTEGKDVRVGRGSNAELMVDDSSLSRLHAAFRLRAGVVEVEDLGSSNGTTVRGVRIAPGAPVPLQVGDVVSLGAVLVVVQLRSGSVADRLRPGATAAASDELVGKIAASTISVLVLGETGVGKEVMAERLHAESPRRHQPLVKINCAALMATVLESELFGHEKGAFTGALKEKQGLIESADGGTLFLDEIGEADPAIQVKLLRVLETRETQRIGALRPRVVDVRIIAATNRVPSDQIAIGALRSDLYYRLAGFTITVPPLRERLNEIPQLVADLLARHGTFTLEPQALATLQRHHWPGNVRELRNVLDRAVVLAERQRITADVIHSSLLAEPPMRSSAPAVSVPSVIAAPPVAAPPMAPPASSPVPPSSEPAEPPPLPQAGADDPERARILGVLEECGGNQSLAAEKLGMSRRALVYRLQAWGMTKFRRRGRDSD